MVKVCQKEFPETDGFYMDGYLKENMDILIESIGNDFDFIILISGKGMTRIGKSQIGKQIGFYINSEVNRIYKNNNEYTAENNFVFRGKQLIEKGKDSPKYVVINFDEAGADLMARKTMHSTTQAVLDYLRECGQKNQFLICILPDFFDLPKGIALTRSVCLIDVDFVEKFNRGKLRFYGRRAKKMLYLKGKKFLDYEAYRPDFHGAFTNFSPIDEEKYKQMKLDALHGREKDETDKANNKNSAYRKVLDKWWDSVYYDYKIGNMTQLAIAKKHNCSQSEVSKIVIALDEKYGKNTTGQ